MTFEEFLGARGAVMARFARALCGDREIAEDVLQEVLLRAHGQWHRIAPMDHPEAYLRRMIVNEHLSWRRRSSRQTRLIVTGPLATVPDPAVQAGNEAQVRALLAELPRRQRAAVVLRYFCDLSDAEIAHAMACSPGTVRAYLSRAMARMRVDLAAENLTSLKGQS